MPRNSAKAIVLHEGRILVNRCVSRFGTYYALPGGGQKHGETLTEAVQRELLEEAGLSVRPMRLSAIYETVSTNRPEGMNHKIYFVFLCALNDVRPVKPSHQDTFQMGTEWIPLSEIQAAFHRGEMTAIKNQVRHTSCDIGIAGTADCAAPVSGQA